MIIEQMTLLVLILSRWLLPKGELTREELSQLLLVSGPAATLTQPCILRPGLHRHRC